MVPAADGDAQEFAAAVLSFLAAARRTRGRLQPIVDDITVPQLVVLDAVDRAGALGVSAVAASVGLAQPTVTRSVSALERMGLVESAAGAADGRVRVIHLTPRGHQVVEAKRAMVLGHLATLWASLDTAEREAAAPLLRHLAELIEYLL